MLKILVLSLALFSLSFSSFACNGMTTTESVEIRVVELPGTIR